ncbi:hypothetical protein SpCBS45565_g06209 [Spizellomyces sp. 'palustris']|nr:hypothetical protein SpCBS45565_g06209 [Spizellomyces sp. 'palustris']
MNTLTGTIAVEHGTLFYTHTPPYSAVTRRPALLLIHAGVADHSMWEPTVAHFSQTGHQVITYDTRGYGRTRNDTTALETASYSNVDDAIALLDHLGVNQVVVVGNSRGGAIALDIALQFPKRVIGVVHICGGVGGLEGPEYDETTSGTDLEKEVFTKILQIYSDKNWDALEDLFATAWADGVGQPLRRSGHVHDRVKQMVHANLAAHEKSGEARAIKPRNPQPSAAERIEQLMSPLLVIVGGLDTSATVRTADWLVSKVEKVTRVDFPHCAHMVSMEEPEKFHRVVEEWLETNVGCVEATV